ncbi:WASH complex subunit FAM21 [Papilio xuthus]|uniref:WASH complex subunit FAM21 n=1 Tax=Papilio xuthus TaxID=66420 RepID=A0A194PTQ8_PAPXU|nr:WASH complex subunit FAM21 [Papilio xuthus]
MAPHWSLAGDKQLLNILQDIHQKIMTRCQETNAKLEEMANALDGANIDLQNVNNKFMALSNSQFIESRVYEDDIVVTNEDTTTKPLPLKDPETELTNLKQSLKTLESMHECVRILNSESDSDSDDDDGRMVFRPKDLYSQRPLPHIIGSQAWKRKWHAGLIAEDSDSDSSTSKAAEAAPDQYSVSESEESDIQTDRLNIPQRTISSSSSMVESEQSAPPTAVSQAHIAAELARKLAGNLPEIPVRTPEPEITKPQQVPAVYKPQKPPTSTIFFDEPPPLDDTYQSDGDDYNDEDDDIFAELHQNKPTVSTNKDQSRLNEDLFGGLNNSSNTVDLFGSEQKETIKPNYEETEPAKDKKPIGGISVFGSMKGTESIGASILKRNPRKTYSSDESDEDMFKSNQKSIQTGYTEGVPSKTNANTVTNKPKDETQTDIQDKPETKEKKPGKPEREILNDLFSKNKPSQIKSKDTKQELITKDKDLFSDNLFDDIDDIFTDNKVPIKEANKNVKSIFDDDDGDDDIFANVTVNETNAPKNNVNEAKDLFDSDSELFSDIPIKTNIEQPSISKVDNNATSDKKNIKSIFDEDSDDDIFSNVQIKDVNIINNKQNNKQTNIENPLKLSEDDDNNNLFSQNTLATDKKDLAESTEKLESDNEIKNKISQNNLASNIFLTPQTTQQTSEQSPALFDDDEIDELFTNNQIKENVILEGDINPTNLNNEKKLTSQEFDDKLKTEVTNKSIDFEKENSNSSSEVATDPQDINVDSFKNDSESHGNNSQNDTKIESDSEIFATKMENTPLPSLPTEQSPADIFNDIFTDVPPDFEKPKEPKKSKNINALFDDDSDDEALFFKKDDAISDEKPEVSSTVKDDLFRIFSDEPPAIDIDLPTETTNEVSEPELPKQILSKDLDELCNQQPKLHDGNQTKDFKEKEIVHKVNDDIDGSIKTIGKLKPMNLNINVNTLLPGASPKISKPIEEPDGLVSIPDTDKQNDTEEIVSTLVKSVSFEGDADSELLNNKLSKERAKIQVKRRPSTRRARREAVKKSGIDFGSTDSTDNSSSIDSPKSTTKTVVSTERNVKSKVVYILNDEDIFTNVKTEKNGNENAKIQTSNENLQTPVNSTEIFVEDIFKQTQSSKIESDSIKSLKTIDKQQTIEKENINSSTKPDNSQKPAKSKASIFDDMSDEETELFCNKKPVVTNTKNIFGCDSDEELFGNNSKKSVDIVEKKSTIKVDVKKSLFDDDSGDDLFGGGKNTGKSISIKPKEIKPTKTEAVVKDPLSLLSDDD